MFVRTLLYFVLASQPVGEISSEGPTPPEDAQMGDGLRLYEEGPQGPETRAVTCASGSTLKGVDISKWQGDVNWTSIAGDGMSFAFVRVSDGLNSKDQKFDRNWEHARNAGLYTGVYQFFRPNQSVIGQADYLLEKMGCDLNAKTCPWSDMDLPPVIDVEYRPSGWSKTQMRNAVRQWIDYVEQFGVEPIIYSGRYFWRDFVDSTEWDDHPFWIAHYTQNCPNIPSHWDNWAFWQYTESGSVSGVNGNTDMNNFNGNLDALKAMRPNGSGGGDGGDDPPPSSCGQIAFDAVTVIDNDDDCFRLGGPDEYWRTEDGGYGDDHHWTNSTSGTEYNYGLWTLNFESGGEYSIQAYVKPNKAEARTAKYVVTHGNGNKTVTIDQRDGDWLDLGSFDFADGSAGQQVRLADKSGRSGEKMVFDAIRIVPEGVDPGDCDEPHNPRVDRDDAGGIDRGGEQQGCRAGGPGAPAGLLLLPFLVLFARSRRTA